MRRYPSIVTDGVEPATRAYASRRGLDDPDSAYPAFVGRSASLSPRLEDRDGAQPSLNAEKPKPDTGDVSTAPVRSWRYGLVPLVALLLPALWLVDGGSATEGTGAAVTGLAVSSVGAYLVWAVRDRSTNEVHLQTAIGWALAVIGGLVPTILFTGWLPSRRPLSRPDLKIETVAGRATIGLAVTVVLFAMFAYITSPRRAGGWLQKWMARRWGHGLCRACGMAIYYGPDHPCSYCGEGPEGASGTATTELPPR